MISRDSPFFYLAEELLSVVLPLGFDGEDACAAPILRGCQAALKHLPVSKYTDKKEKKIFLRYVLYKEIYEVKSFLIYEERRKYLVIYEEAVFHI